MSAVLDEDTTEELIRHKPAFIRRVQIRGYILDAVNFDTFFKAAHVALMDASDKSPSEPRP